MAPKLQFRVMVDPLGTDLVKSGSLRANTLPNETSKTNLPQHPATFTFFTLLIRRGIFEGKCIILCMIESEEEKNTSQLNHTSKVVWKSDDTPVSSPSRCFN